MIKLRDLIPTVETLKRRADKSKPVKPTEASKAEMTKYLESIGYLTINPEVHHTIVSYGALLIDGTAKKGLLISGEVGIGKSFGAEVIAARFGYPVFNPFIVISLFKELNGNLYDLEKIIVSGADYFEKPMPIVIDELGIEEKARNYGEVADIMADVIDMRYRAFLNHGVITIITTNLDDRAILNRYGKRTDDRLNEMCIFKAVNGKSLRK